MIFEAWKLFAKGLAFVRRTAWLKSRAFQAPLIRPRPQMISALDQFGASTNKQSALFMRCG